MPVPWQIDVVCKTCGYVAATGALTVEHGDGKVSAMEVPADCPACYIVALKGKAPGVGASRLTVWREVRRARKALRSH